MYNPGLGRFLSVDPLTSSYPWYTPYQFARNEPIWSIDIDGLEPQRQSTNDDWGGVQASTNGDENNVQTYYPTSGGGWSAGPAKAAEVIGTTGVPSEVSNTPAEAFEGYGSQTSGYGTVSNNRGTTYVQFETLPDRTQRFYWYSTTTNRWVPFIPLTEDDLYRARVDAAGAFSDAMGSFALESVSMMATAGVEGLIWKGAMKGGGWAMGKLGQYSLRIRPAGFGANFPYAKISFTNKFKRHFRDHKGILEQYLGKKYPKIKTHREEFLRDIQSLIENGDVQFVGKGTLGKGQSAVDIYRGNGMTLVMRPMANFIEVRRGNGFKNPIYKMKQIDFKSLLGQEIIDIIQVGFIDKLPDSPFCLFEANGRQLFIKLSNCILHFESINQYSELRVSKVKEIFLDMDLEEEDFLLGYQSILELALVDLYQDLQIVKVVVFTDEESKCEAILFILKSGQKLFLDPCFLFGINLGGSGQEKLWYDNKKYRDEKVNYIEYSID